MRVLLCSCAELAASRSWPTIPQVFLRGEFIGGADIMIQHFKAGELEAMLKDTPASESK